MVSMEKQERKPHWADGLGWVVLVVLVLIAAALAGMSGCGARDPHPSIGQVALFAPDAGHAKMFSHGIITNSGVPFAPKEPSVVVAPVTMTGKFDYSQPTFLIGYEECHRNDTNVWECCAAGFTDGGLCEIPDSVPVRK